SSVRGGRVCLLAVLVRWGFATIRHIGTHSFLSKHYRAIKNIIARGAAAFSPFRTRRRPGVADTIDIRGVVIGTNLLAMAINAPIRGVNLAAAIGHARLRSGASV